MLLNSHESPVSGRPSMQLLRPTVPSEIRLNSTVRSIRPHEKCFHRQTKRLKRRLKTFVTRCAVLFCRDAITSVKSSATMTTEATSKQGNVINSVNALALKAIVAVRTVTKFVHRASG